MKGIWITWEFQRRNLGISSSLGWPLYQIEINSASIIRYIVSSWKTFLAVRKENPDVIAVQNPSMVLAFWGLFLAKLFRKKIVIDTHNCSIFPLEGRYAILMWVSRWLQRSADMIIVTNDVLRDLIVENGGVGFSLPDKISTPPNNIQITPLARGTAIVFICTYSEDEPFNEVIQAARSLPDDVELFFTGNHHGKVHEDTLPDNVHMLGFVSESRFWEVLASADIIMDLTTRENCLVCGAYEGVSLEKPLILSKTKAIVSYFHKGCVYVEPAADSIREGILKARDRLDEMSEEIGALKSELNVNWASKIENLKKQVGKLLEK